VTDTGLLSLSPYRARCVAAVFEAMFPAGPDHPGAVEIGAVAYLDRALAGHDRHQRDAYDLGLDALDREARRRHGAGFADCAPASRSVRSASWSAAGQSGKPARWRRRASRSRASSPRS